MENCAEQNEGNGRPERRVDNYLLNDDGKLVKYLQSVSESDSIRTT